jgi:hypothetical protein
MVDTVVYQFVRAHGLVAMRSDVFRKPFAEIRVFRRYSMQRLFA